MDLALDEAVKRIKEAEPTAPVILILLTAGRQAAAKTLVESSKPLHDLGVYSYVVAIGNHPDKDELEPVVDNPGDIISVSSFDNLEPRRQKIAKDIAKESSESSSHIYISIHLSIYLSIYPLSVCLSVYTIYGHEH